MLSPAPFLHTWHSSFYKGLRSFASNFFLCPLGFDAQKSGSKLSKGPSRTGVLSHGPLSENALVVCLAAATEHPKEAGRVDSGFWFYEVVAGTGMGQEQEALVTLH